MTCIDLGTTLNGDRRNPRHAFLCVDGSYDTERFTKRRPNAPDCPNEENHTPEPPGYLDWHSWAARMMRTHSQVRCSGCNLYAIWLPKRPFVKEPPKRRGRPPKR